LSERVRGTQRCPIRLSEGGTRLTGDDGEPKLAPISPDAVIWERSGRHRYPCKAINSGR